MKNVIIAGASGMVGNLVLQECIDSPDVHKVVSLVRKKGKTVHDKLQEEIIKDFSDYSAIVSLFRNIDAAFFCIGAYGGQVSDDEFKRITVDYAFSFAKTLKEYSPNSNLCLLSGAGADRTEKSKIPFAKYKGIAENKISRLGLKFYSFRPGYIYPVTPRKEPNFFYKIIRVLYPIIKLFGRNASIKSTELASAMYQIGINGADKEILENREILKLFQQNELKSYS
jgi:uncharacterized protein YbjT (DUF2867 family)